MAVENRAIAALAVCIAIGGVLLAASAMSIVATDSPGNEFVDDEESDVRDEEQLDSDEQGQFEDDKQGKLEGDSEATVDLADWLDEDGDPEGELADGFDGGTVDDTTIGSALPLLAGIFAADAGVEAGDFEDGADVEGEEELGAAEADRSVDGNLSNDSVDDFSGDEPNESTGVDGRVDDGTEDGSGADDLPAEPTDDFDDSASDGDLEDADSIDTIDEEPSGDDGDGENGSNGDGIDGDGSVDGVDEGQIDGDLNEGQIDGDDLDEEATGDVDDPVSRADEPADDAEDSADTAEESADDADDDEAGASDPFESIPLPSGTPLSILLAAAAAVAVVAVAYTRADPIGTIKSIPGRIVSLALALVVSISRAVERAVAALSGLSSVAEVSAVVLAALAGAIAAFRRRTRAMAATVLPIDGPAESAATAGSADERLPARERIHAAFEAVVDASGLPRRSASRTPPGHIAWRAKRRGAPAAPVETITDSFRDVEYGDRDPDRYLEATATAHDRLRETLADEAGQGNETKDENRAKDENETKDENEAEDTDE